MIVNHPNLSGRENEIADLVRRDFTNKEIARRLDLSVNTVGSYLRRMYPKLQVRSRAGLVGRLLTQDAEDDTERCPHCGGKLA